MRLKGFIGPAYTLDSVNVEAQRCVNLYPELIESKTGRDVAYLKGTPGLEKLVEVGDGPIRLIHVDSVGRKFVVSGNKLYTLTKSDNWELLTINVVSSTLGTVDQSSGVNTTTNVFTAVGGGYDIDGETTIKVRVSSSGTLPTGLLEDTDYWIIKGTSTTFKLASSLANALAGTEIDISNAGTGTMTVALQLTDNLLDIKMADIDYDTGEISYEDHGYYTGYPIKLATTGVFPDELDLDTVYYVIRVDDDTLKLASSIGNASAGTSMSLTEPDEDWAAVLVPQRSDAPENGTLELGTSTGPVKAASMSESGGGEDYLTIFVDGNRNYRFYYDPSLNRNVFEYNGDSGDLGAVDEGPKASHVAFIDGYFLVNKINSSQFFVSDLQETTFSDLSFASSEGDPDKILGLIANYRDLWVFNERSTEVYVNTGNADFPFERVQGGFLEIGCAAKYSIAKIDGTVFWLGRGEHGQGRVYAAASPNPQRISTHAIEQAIAGYANVSGATAYTYHSKGHSFYVLNFDEATWVYDLTTGLWHERAYTNSGNLERHRGDCCAFDPVSGLHLVGDYDNNKVYAFNDEYYSDDGTEITRLRSSPHVSDTSLNRVFCHKFQLDMETGIGLVSGQGSTPQVMLDFSDDGGHTWSSESWVLADAQAGQIGEYKARVIWRRLGSFRDRVFRVKVTDPVKVVLMGAEMDLELGAS